MKLLELMPSLALRREFGFFQDFLYYSSGGEFTSLASDAGISAPALASGTAFTGGVLTQATASGTANTQLGVTTTNTPFLFLNERPLVFEICLQFTEANTNNAGIFAGFSSILNADNQLVNTTLLPASSFSGAGIFKCQGSNVWQFVTSVGSTQSITASQHTAGGSAYQTLRIEIRQGSAGASGLEAVPLLGAGTPGGATLWTEMKDTNNKPIKQYITYTSAANMYAGYQLKNGSTAQETLLVDYLAAYELRQ